MSRKLYEPMFWFPEGQPPLGWVEVEPDYEAAETSYMKDTGNVSEKAIRTAVDAALQEDT